MNTQITTSLKRLCAIFLGAAALALPAGAQAIQSAQAENTSPATVQVQPENTGATAHAASFNAKPVDWIKRGRCRSNAAIKGGVICPPDRRYPGNIPPNWQDYPPF